MALLIEVLNNSPIESIFTLSVIVRHVASPLTLGSVGGCLSTITALEAYKLFALSELYLFIKFLPFSL